MNLITVIKNILFIEGFFFIFTGLWPIVDNENFIEESDPNVKVDLWLIVTAGWLLALLGVIFLIETLHFQNHLTISWGVLFGAFTMPLLMASSDIYYVSKKIILPINLLDCIIEILFAAAWIFVLIKS